MANEHEMLSVWMNSYVLYGLVEFLFQKISQLGEWVWIDL